MLPPPQNQGAPARPGTILARLQAVHYHGPGFDLLRLAAASVVVLHHALDVNFDKVAIDPLYRWGHQQYHVGFLAVATFFAISGFLVSPGLLRNRNVVAFALKRALRIVPLLAVVVVASIFLLGPALTRLPLAAYFVHSETYDYAANVLTSMRRYLPGVVDGAGAPAIVNGALWTLRFEVIAYLVLAALSLLGALRRRWLFAVFWLGAYALSAGTHLAPAHLAGVAPALLTFASLFAYFGAGVGLFLFAERIPLSPAWAWSGLGLTLVALTLGLAPLLMPLTLTYAAVVLGLSNLPLRGPLVGYDLSYGIYLTHGPLMLFTLSVLPLPRVWWLVCLVTLALAAATAAVTWRLIEHPALRQKDLLARATTTPIRRLMQVFPLAGRLIGLRGPVVGATRTS